MKTEERFAKRLVSLTGVFFLIYGILFVLFPAQLMEAVTDGALTTTSASIDVRSTYGGMSIAVGAVLILMARKPQTLRLGLLIVVLLMLCMAAGRLFGFAVDGDPNRVMYAYLALEILVIAAAGFLLRATSDAPSTASSGADLV